MEERVNKGDNGHQPFVDIHFSLFGTAEAWSKAHARMGWRREIWRA